MNTYGKIFKISVWGGSHTSKMGVILDSVPPGIELNETMFQNDMERRKPLKKGTTKRKEEDIPEIISGIYRGKTTGAPLHIVFENKNQKSADYHLRDFPRPGHADFAANIKYKAYNKPEGGDIFSGRMTVLIVAAGVVAKKINSGINFTSKIKNIGGYEIYEDIIEKITEEGDSLGGEVECRISNLPAGIGEPFFDSVESEISKLLFSVPGAKAIAFGDGFKSDIMKGSEFNDAIINEKGETATNHDGGINGGISNGNEIIFSVKFKPASSISKTQNTWIPAKNKRDKVTVKGRHDVCYTQRTPVILEAVAAIAITDLIFIKQKYYE